jgi:hypothetical protein
MSRPINTHRKAVLTAQAILKDAEKKVTAAGYTLAALLERAGVTRERWGSWMTGRACPQGRNLEAVRDAAAAMARGEG